MKRCTKCLIEKAETNFHRDGKGFCAQCKTCKIKASRAWLVANPEVQRETKRRYYQKKMSEIKAKTKAYRESHPEKYKFYRDTWAKNNPLKIKESASKYGKSLKGRISILAETHWHRIRRINPHATKTIFTYPMWLELLEKQGHKCAMCQELFTERKRATIDHIIPIRIGGTNDIGNIQALCQRCNSLKYFRVERLSVRT